MSLSQTTNTVSDLVLSICALYISGRLLLAHAEEAKSAKAQDIEVQRKHMLNAETLRQLASFQHPLFLGTILAATTAKIAILLASLNSGA